MKDKIITVRLSDEFEQELEDRERRLCNVEEALKAITDQITALFHMVEESAGGTGKIQAQIKNLEDGLKEKLDMLERKVKTLKSQQELPSSMKIQLPKS